MRSQGFKMACINALDRYGFERQSSRSTRGWRRSSELIWVLEPEKTPNPSRWTLEIGALATALEPDEVFPGGSYPDVNHCHFAVDYVFFGTSLPPVPTPPGCDTHKSYFTYAFDIENEEITDSEKIAAVEFAIHEVSLLCTEVYSLNLLKKRIESEAFGSFFLHRKLRDLLASLG